MNKEESRLEVKMQKLQQNRNELLERYKLELCLERRKYKKNIKAEIKKNNDKELEEEIKSGRKTK